MSVAVVERKTVVGTRVFWWSSSERQRATSRPGFLVVEQRASASDVETWVSGGRAASASERRRDLGLLVVEQRAPASDVETRRLVSPGLDVRRQGALLDQRGMVVEQRAPASDVETRRPVSPGLDVRRQGALLDQRGMVVEQRAPASDVETRRTGPLT